ncbi:MAG: molybdenum cofactor guanylyltransferase [Chloroflexi bacterium]|nr:molybdenum cofactor guanylyltransferase [Chloroflexota bacterium]MCL5273970.1 molybdenum cofactor guanylyltransferase [Chloroflexota bacterium]
MSNESMLTVVIQAGGESRRMGEDKALRLFLGQPLIARVLSRVESLADELLVVTNRPAVYAFLNCALVADVLPGRGALGGLYTALSVASHAAVAVIGCDMPFVSATLLKRQYELLCAEGVDAVVPRTPNGWEPLHAVYHRATCQPAVYAALEAGTWRISDWLKTIRLHTPDMAEVQQYDPQQRAFWNVNTPEEFAQAERWAAAGDEDK